MRALPQVSGLQYASYAALVGIKRLLHLPRTGHRRFFVLQLVRALNANRIGAGCHITATGKLDGAGAQAQAKMSAMCLAHAYGLRYVHSPFVSVAHAECPMPQWVAAWEDFFNFGAGELRIDQVDLPRLDIETFVSDPSLWDKPCVIVARHYHTFCDLQPDAYCAILPRLREKIRPQLRPVNPSSVLNVCVHVRRGDVAPGDTKTSHRYTGDRDILNTLRLLQEVLSRLERPGRVRVFSQGDPARFACFADLGCELYLNQPAMDTFRELLAADVLVMARSAFSYSAALLGNGVNLYDPQDHAPLSQWIVTDRRSGAFDAERFAARLNAACG
jgi:hypothetical protein